MNISELITRFNAQIFFLPAKMIQYKRAISFSTLDGYGIAVSDSLSPERLAETIEHELWHIILGHYDERRDLSEEKKEYEVIMNMEE